MSQLADTVDEPTFLLQSAPAIAGLDVAIPEIVAEGEREGWAYLAMTRLEGSLGATA